MMKRRIDLLSIDPGKKHVAWAAWIDKKLVACNLWIGSRELFVQRFHYAPEVVVSECPKVYTREKSKADPADLIELALTAGACLTLATREAWVIYPHEWKGSLPHEAMWARAERQLSPEEREAITVHARKWVVDPGMRLDSTTSAVELRPLGALAHNVQDAVGIGLRVLGRY